MSQKTDLEAKQELLPMLNKNYGTEILEQYGRLLEMDDILDFQMSRWPIDPLFYGSYTNVRYGQNKTGQKLARRGLGNLYISGENSCDRHQGYIHGALFSGERTCKMILKENYPGYESVDTRTLCDTHVSELTQL